MKGIILGAILITCIGCSDKIPRSDFPEKPSRTAYEGFHWEVVEGRGLKFWAQRNANLGIVINDTSACAQIIRKDSPYPNQSVIRMFYLPDKRIENVLDILRTEPEWEENICCTFQQVKTRREGVKRYILVPDGKDAEEFQQRSNREPIPATCNGWGVGNSGMRCFEIHDAYPEIAIFMEIGQDAPLFDEQSIVITDLALAEASGKIRHVKGTLVIGHEVRSFTAYNDGIECWVTDSTEDLYQQYDQISGGKKNGMPLEAELLVREQERPSDGFAAEYPKSYQIIKIINLKKQIE